MVDDGGSSHGAGKRFGLRDNWEVESQNPKELMTQTDPSCSGVMWNHRFLHTSHYLKTDLL